MQNLWWKIWEMGLAAGWLVLVFLVLRLVCRRLLPHNIRCVLWMLVAVRLICPVMPESRFSLIPGGGEQVFADRGVSYLEEESGTRLEETIGLEQAIRPTEKENGGVRMPTAARMEEGGERGAEQVPPPVSLRVFLSRPGQDVFAALTEWLRQYLPGWLWAVWLAGTALMAGYGIYSYWHMRYLVRDAIPEPAEGSSACIWRSDRIRGPFVLGILRPRIYLPCGAPEETREYVLAHEQAHISRRDPLVKLAGYALLTVYWFQPLIWLAYGLLCRDIELACDERVIRSYGRDTRRKRGYMEALLALSTQENIQESGTLAFGEGGVRRRIGNLLHYKRPAVWTVGISAILCAAAAVCFLTNPRRGDASGEDMPGQENVMEPDDTNLMALPMGQRVSVDLDGDGEEEIVRVTVSNENEAAQANNGNWCYANPVIWVGEQSYVPDIFFENMDLCTWYLFRVGGESEGWQIGLYEDGPSADPSTHLFAWGKGRGAGELVHLGAFLDNPVDYAYPGDWWGVDGQEPGEYEGHSYEEMLELTDRDIGAWMRIPGDGSIYARRYMDIVQSEQMVVQWKLREIRENGLELQEQPRYEFWNVDAPYTNEYAYCAKEEFYVYAEPDTQAETAAVPAGETVVFLFYDAESGWIELGYNQGEKTGYILSDAPYSSILLAPGPEGGAKPISQMPRDVLDGLHMTD